MKPFAMHRLPLWIIMIACGLLLAHGPVAQLDHYHEFADQSVLAGMRHAADVLSNLGFALVAAWGLCILGRRHDHPAIRAGWPGYRLFLVGLLLTAFGSSFYHLAPDNARLVWDRLPIALACAGLLAAVSAETQPGTNGQHRAIWLALLAVVSVAWWRYTDLQGVGDLRPYLLLQGLPIILIPVWQAVHRAPHADRLWFGLALLMYVFAKFAELNDHRLLMAFGWISGHTLKHLLATCAAALLVGRLAARISAGGAADRYDAYDTPDDSQGARTGRLLVG